MADTAVTALGRVGMCDVLGTQRHQCFGHTIAKLPSASLQRMCSLHEASPPSLYNPALSSMYCSWSNVFVIFLCLPEIATF